MARGESPDHAPGHDISSSGGVRQHKMMAMGDGPSGSFGVRPIPGTDRIKHPEGEPSGKMLSDSERGCGPAMKTGRGEMHASRNPDHGPHYHQHTEVPKGHRPHHV